MYSHHGIYNPWSRDPFQSTFSESFRHLNRMLDDFNIDHDDWFDHDDEQDKSGTIPGTSQSQDQLQQGSAASDEPQGGQPQGQKSGGQLTSTTQRGTDGTMTAQQRRDLIRSGEIPRLAALRVHNHKDRLSLDFEVPGIKKEDLKVNLDGDMLTVRGETQKTHEDKGFKKSSRVSFHRTLRLPMETFDENSIKANYEDGCLRIDIKKKPEEEQQKKSKSKQLAIN